MLLKSNKKINLIYKRQFHLSYPLQNPSNLKLLSLACSSRDSFPSFHNYYVRVLIATRTDTTRVARLYFTIQKIQYTSRLLKNINLNADCEVGWEQLHSNSGRSCFRSIFFLKEHAWYRTINCFITWALEKKACNKLLKRKKNII